MGGDFDGGVFGGCREEVRGDGRDGGGWMDRFKGVKAGEGGVCAMGRALWCGLSRAS